MDYKRKDVVFKNLLRKVRAVYLSRFSKFSGYSANKNEEGRTLLLEKLIKYIKSEIVVKRLESPKDQSANEINESLSIELTRGLAYFLASLLYPKMMASLVRESAIKQETKAIHNSLYKFSIGNLDYLL